MESIVTIKLVMTKKTIILTYRMIIIISSVKIVNQTLESFRFNFNSEDLLSSSPFFLIYKIIGYII